MNRLQTSLAEKASDAHKRQRMENPLFNMGPDGGVDQPDGAFDPFWAGSLRGSRPYFVVPVEEGGDERSRIRQRILAWVEEASQIPVATLIRDVDLLRPAALIDWLRAAPISATKSTTPISDKAVIADISRSHDIALYVRGRLSIRARALLDTLPQTTLNALAGIDNLGRRADEDRPEELISFLGSAENPTPLRGMFESIISGLNELLLGPVLYSPAAFDCILSGKYLALAERASLPDICNAERSYLNRLLLARAINSCFSSDAPVLVPEPDKRGPVTDIYVASHGWHRNFFGAVAAYDRLFSRFAVLLSRRRLQSPHPYHPLFLMLHWNSDPGRDGWVDASGRRKFPSFLAKVETVFLRPTEEQEIFLPPGARFSDTFEDVFEYFTRISTSDANALVKTATGSEDGIEDDPLHFHISAIRGAQKLSSFQIRDAPYATPSEKISTAWRCYFESEAQRPLLNQMDQPIATLSFWRWGQAVVKFLIAVGGVAVIIDLIKKMLDPARWEKYLADCTWTDWVGFVGIGFAVGSIVLLLCVGVQKWIVKDKQARGKPILALGGWFLMQLPLFLFQLAMLFFGATLASLLALLPLGPFLRDWIGLYDERNGPRDALPEPLAEPEAGTNRGSSDLRRWIRVAFTPRLFVAALSRLPIYLLRNAVSADTQLPRFITTIDNQLAFWEMQVRGVAAGESSADFLAQMYSDLEQKELLLRNSAGDADVRIHMMGHSFGGLVICNALRKLALTNRALQDKKPGFSALTIPSVTSICLIEAAIASAWYEKEETVRKYIRGALVCIFSGYDTANSFYYPLANAARSAAGYLGLTYVGARNTGQRISHLPPLPTKGETETPNSGTAALFASILQTPRLIDSIRQYSNAALVANMTRLQSPIILNLDASRVIFDGPVSSGGGHDDIFKDDVVHLIWAATTLGDDQDAQVATEVSIARTAGNP